MGIFPFCIIGLGLKEESFLKDVDVVSNLKIRTGYGLTGNQDAISAYNSLKLMSPTGVTTVMVSLLLHTESIVMITLT